MNTYPKRLIEVDLPIKRISAHARREKSIRHGHISTLHIWWARRPLAACRAVLCAALWPDPADANCPETFVQAATELMADWCTHDKAKLHSFESYEHFVNVRAKPGYLADRTCLRGVLLDFIADFANWDNATQPDYLATAQALTGAAHVALGGLPGTRPLVVDPFAGGGSIPLEALRVGADAFASDLNPIPVLINKVQLEYIPKYGKKLADEVRKWGAWMKDEAAKDLARFYPSLSNPTVETYTPQVPEAIKRQGRVWKLKRIVAETPIAYLWARTIVCEGPSCGAEVPLMRSTYLVKKTGRNIGLRIVPKPAEKRVDFEIVNGIRAADTTGTVQRGNATCPCCGYGTPVTSVRRQLKTRNGGANDARLFAVVTSLQTERRNSGETDTFNEQGRYYRQPTETDLAAIYATKATLQQLKDSHSGPLSLVPDEEICLNEIRRISVPLYGMKTWGDLFSPRQALFLATLQNTINTDLEACDIDKAIRPAVQTCLAILANRQANAQTSVSRWHTGGEKVEGVFSRQAIGMMWDYAEANPFSGSSGDFEGAINWIVSVCEHGAATFPEVGSAERSSATEHLLPSDSAQAVVTDPPYYDAVPYSHLSDFFYVWLRRSLRNVHPDLFRFTVVEKDQEIVVDRPHELSTSTHDIAYYERELKNAFAESRRILMPNGICTIVFASKTASSWEAILQATVDAGWTITGSWPIDTEMEARISAQGQARLASSIHLVCRPREHEDGTLILDEVGDWRDVLRALPKRIHEWMPRLAAEGVVGADAIFACLGPALEIFSQYSRVEKPNGDVVALREYLEQVWAAVSQEALNQVFAGGDTKGFEEDARLTAMWLWTLSASTSGPVTDADDEESNEDDEGNVPAKKKLSGFVLDYDTARKIAQGLGANLAGQEGLIEIKGDKARLLPVSERTRSLFGQEGLRAEPVRKKPILQLAINFAPAAPNFVSEPEVGYELPELKVEQTGKTVLDRLHQAMLLFDSGRTEALKRFLVEDGVGRDERFWKLAQALNALYPKDTPERRWVEAIQTYKKGLGL